MLDDSNITIISEGSTSSQSTSMPTDSQTIFGSKYDNAYYMVNSLFKVQRVAYALNNSILADFRAARKNDIYGFFDIVSNIFCPGTNGSFSYGNQLAMNANKINMNDMTVKTSPPHLISYELMSIDLLCTYMEAA